MTDKPKPLDLKGMNIYKKIKVDFGSGKPKIIYDEKEAINEIKQRIKSACEFYLKYRDEPELLTEEHPCYEHDVFDIINECMTLDLSNCETMKKYNEWLFKLAFKDVLENEERDKDDD